MFSSKDFAVSENTVKINSIPPNFWTDLCTGGVELKLTVSVSPEIADLVCPSCGYNLGLKTLEENTEKKSHTHSKHKASSNPDANSRKLPLNAGRKHSFDESEFPVCNADYGIYNTRSRHRTLSELLRLDKSYDQSCLQDGDENNNQFSNDWVKNGRNEQAQKTRKNKPNRIQNGWWSTKESINENGESRNTEKVPLHSRINSFENSQRETHVNRNNSLNERAIIEQNSRTILRDRKIVQKMRNCWERFLKIRLQATEISDESTQKNEFIGNSQTKKNIQHSSQIEKCSACGTIRRNTIPIHNKKVSMTHETKRSSIKNENENRNNKQPEDSQSIVSKKSTKRTFKEIRNGFELGALQNVERIPDQNEHSNAVYKNKSVKQRESTQQRKLSSMSSQDKVKLWMERNETTTENSGSTTTDSDHYLSAKNYSSHSKFSSQSDTNVYKNTFDESKWSSGGGIKGQRGANSTDFKVCSKNTIQRAGNFQQLKNSTQNQRIQTNKDDNTQKSPPVPHLTCE